MSNPAVIGAIGTIIISVLSIVGGYLLKMHIKSCKCFRIYCECVEKDKNNNNNDNNNNNNNNINNINNNNKIIIIKIKFI